MYFIKIPLLKLVTFCRKTSNVCWWSFVDWLLHYNMLGSKVTWVTTASCCYTILEFENLLLTAAGYFESPLNNTTKVEYSEMYQRMGQN